MLLFLRFLPLVGLALMLTAGSIATGELAHAMAHGGIPDHWHHGEHDERDELDHTHPSWPSADSPFVKGGSPVDIPVAGPAVPEPARDFAVSCTVHTERGSPPSGDPQSRAPPVLG